MFNLFRLCRKDEISFNNVAKNGNSVKTKLDFVAAIFNFVERIVPLVAFDNVAGVDKASTKLPVASTMLL